MAEETEVVLSANTQSYERNVDAATQSTNRLLDSVIKLTTAMDGAFKTVGKTMQIGGTGMAAGLVAMGVAAGRLDQQMSQLQASMTMVSKGEEDATRRIKDYDKAVTSLRSNFGVTSQEAINLVSQLNKMGQSSVNVDKLATSFTKLGAITGEGVGQLTQNMLQLQRTMGTEGVTQTENFNATLAKLSQTAGVSATAITQFSQSIAPIGKVSGMTQKEIMGVSTAFVKAGADGFAASNTFNKMLTDITRSIQYGSPELKAYADLIGVSVENFKQMPRTEAITQIFEQINKQGPQAIKTLERFGLDGVRSMKAIQSVAGTGGIRGAVATAMGSSPTGQFDDAANKSFDGLNDQMSKIAENAKMIGEAFGKGVLPALELTAKAVNLILSPINMVLQGLGKLPGGFAMVSAAALLMGGTLLKAFTGLSTFGMLKGAGTTALQGLRMGAADRLASEGDPSGIYGLNAKDRAVWEERQKFRRGEDALGSPQHHAMYAGYERVGSVFGRARENLGETPGRYRDNLRTGFSRAAGWTSQFLGQAARAGLDPLSFRASRNNLNRDQGVQFMPKADVYNALGYQDVKERWQGWRNRGDEGEDETGKKYKRGMNTAYDSTMRLNGGLAQSVREFALFNKALAQAGAKTAMVGGRGVYEMGRAGGRAAGGLLMSGVNALGGPAAVGMMAGTALVGAAWNQYKSSGEKTEQVLANTDNTSPYSKWASSVGEATLATENFADVMKQAAEAAAAREKWSPKPSAAVIEQAQKKGAYSNPDLKDANYSETKQLVNSAMANNPSDLMKSAIQKDLLMKYGTDAEGQRITENVMKQGQNVSGLNLTTLMQRAQHQRGLLNFFGASDASQESGKSIGDTIAEQMFNSGADRQQKAQMAIVALNQAQRVKGGNGDRVDQVPLGVGIVRGVLNKQPDPGGAQTTHVVDAIMQHGRDPIELQNALAGDRSPIGDAYREALANVGPNFNRRSTTFPIGRTYTDPWLSTGLDQSVLDRLQGVTKDRTLMPGQPGYNVDTQPGELNKLASSIFGGSTQTGVGSAVSAALSQEANKSQQWTGMEAITNQAIKMTSSFSAAVGAIDEMTAAAGGAATPLGQLDMAARSRVMQFQAEAAPYMTQRGALGEQVGMFAQNLATNARAPSQESGDLLEASRQTLAGTVLAKKEQLKSFVTQLREFNISRGQQEEDYAQQREWSQEDYDRQRGYAEHDFNQQRKWSENDYNRQRQWAQADFDKSRRRTEENYQHQIVLMTKQTASEMTNIYERMNVQRTWDAANLFENMQDQQTKLAEQQANLARLRKAGLSDATIEQMKLADPANMQQTASLADGLVGNQKLIDAYNKMARDREKVAGKVVKDPSSTQWKEMQYSHKKALDQGMQDYQEALDHQAIQHKEALDHQDISVQQSWDRQDKSFALSMDHQAITFKKSLDRSAESLNRSMEEVTNNFAELQKLALAGLHGTAKTQMKNILDDMNEIAPLITGKVDTTSKQVEALFKRLGIPPLTPMAAYQPGGSVYNSQVPVQARATGGPIEGQSPHKRADNIPILATAGEYMQPVDSVNYYGKGFMDAVRDRRLPKYADGGMVYKQMEAWMGKNLPGVAITSDYRPGAITALGNVSMHSQGKAVDMAPSMETFNKILNTFGSKIYQLFYSPADGRTILRGKPWKMDSVTKSGHYNHVHWAMQSMNGLADLIGAAGGTWDGSAEGLLAEVKKLGSVKNFNAGMNKSLMYGTKYMGNDWLAKAITGAGMARAASTPGIVDMNFSPSSVGNGSIKSMVQGMAAKYGWTGNNWNALDQLVAHESSWNPNAANPGSTAYGLFQFLNSTWGSVGGTKTSNPRLQAQYGLKYIDQRYGDPSKAWSFWNSHTPHWYGDGAVFNGKKTIGVGENGPEAVLPLNQRGVDFMFEVMKRNSSDSKRALVASGGVPLQASTVSYYSRIDKSTQITGPITVQAQDPDEMLRKIRAKKALETLKGRQ